METHRPPMLAVGERVDRYVVLAHLATSSMAELWLARLGSSAAPPRAGEPLYALKILKPSARSPQAMIRAFRFEAELGARVRNPHLVPTVDTGIARGTWFLVMPFVRGVPVGDLCTTRNVERRDALVLRVIVDALTGLRALHEEPQGPIVHRDVSASNLRAGADGNTRLLDFGIAIDPQHAPAPHGFSGKRGYIAPEVLAGARPSVASDIYSFSMVLWQLATGLRLRPDGSRPGPVHALPSELGIRPSPVFDAIVRRGLDPDPRARWASAAEMRHALLVNGAVRPASRAEVAAWVRAVGDERGPARDGDYRSTNVYAEIPTARLGAPERGAVPLRSVRRAVPVGEVRQRVRAQS